MAIGIFSGLLLGIITDIEVDAKFSEQHGMTATPATFALENGAVVSDHIVLNPVTLEIPYELNNQDLNIGGLQLAGNIGLSYGIKSAVLYNILRLNLTNRGLYTIVTRHVLYRNMALIDAGAEHVAPAVGTIRGTAKFQQMNLPAIQNVSVPQDILDQDGTQFKAASTLPAGAQISKDGASSPNLLATQNATWGS